MGGGEEAREEHVDVERTDVQDSHNCPGISQNKLTYNMYIVK